MWELAKEVSQHQALQPIKKRFGHGLSQPPEKKRTFSTNQWESQDPKMEVVYHVRPYIGGISLYIHSPYIGPMYGRHLHFMILEFQLNKFG